MTDIHDLSEAEKAWLVAYVERTTAAQRALLTAEGGAALQASVFEAITANPGARELVRRLAPRDVVDVSGTNAIDRGALGASADDSASTLEEGGKRRAGSE